MRAVECPRCRTRGAKPRIVQSVFFRARWKCANCGSILTFSFKRWRWAVVVLVVDAFALTMGSQLLRQWSAPDWAGLFLATINGGVLGLFGSQILKPVVDVPRGRHCAGCGYNLRGMTSERCPECGLRFTVPPAQQFDQDRE